MTNKINPVVLFSRASDADERERQISYARQLPEVNGGKEYLESKKQRQKAKTGHESCLAKVVAERRFIEIIFRDMQENVIGELLEFDEFAIRVREEDQTCTWYFKSAIAGFKEVGK